MQTPFVILALAFIFATLVELKSVPRTNGFFELDSSVYHVDSPIGGSGHAKLFHIHNIKTKERFVMKESQMMIGGEKEITVYKHLPKASKRILKLYASEQDLVTVKMIVEQGDENVRKFLERKNFEISNVFSQMVLAVEELHSHNVVHADLKPDNFLMVRNVVKVFDFDLSGVVSDQEPFLNTPHMQGTPDYMSTEAVSRQNPMMDFTLGKKTDIWTLGVILYEIVYGKLPMAHITDIYQKFEFLYNSFENFKFPQVEPGKEVYVKIVKECLHKDPSMRPTIEELKKILIDLNLMDQSLYEVPPATPALIENPTYDGPLVVKISNTPFGFLEHIKKGTDTVPWITKVVDLRNSEIQYMQQVDFKKPEIKQEYLHDLEIKKSLAESEYVYQPIVSEVINNTLLSIYDKEYNQTLDSLISSRSIKDISSLFRSLVLAIKSIHEKNIVHVFPFPSNIRISTDQKIKLDQFTRSQTLTPETPEFSLTNRPTERSVFVSPEVLSGGKITKAADIWTIGMILYHMIYEKLPFDDLVTTQEKIKAVFGNREIPFPEISGENEKFVEIVKRSLKYSPDERLTAVELLNALDGKLKDEHDQNSFATKTQYLCVLLPVLVWWLM